jgi:hypothetical protein
VPQIARKVKRRLPLANRTVAELMRAAIQDFEDRRAEQFARALIPQRGELLRDAGEHSALVRAERHAALSGPNRERILVENAKLRAALARPRRQPPKSPNLDTAMLNAVARGESPSLVVEQAIASLHITEPSTAPTPALRRRLLDRLKKKRRS